MAEFHLSILSADKTFYDGQCTSMVVPTADGLMGVMAYHSNMITAIVPGDLKYRTDDDVQHDVVVSAGIMKIENNNVELLVLTAERPEDIDLVRAEEAAREARAALASKQSAHEHDATMAKLARAMNRIQVAELGEKYKTGVARDAGIKTK